MRLTELGPRAEDVAGAEAQLKAAQAQYDKTKTTAGKLAGTGATMAVAGAATFARLYFLPVQRHALPEQVRMAPAW